jgi:hypothetical protein
MGIRCRRWPIADGRSLGIADDEVGMRGSADVARACFSGREDHNRIHTPR